ncbi:MAG: hypothetical protein HY922_08590 [Elusimicrobia bacterium]|nr:hypothetical protein [Elusimicrobiota bacterium]
MRRLFRSFDRSGLKYLLISGQASVLYGAATFSEDIDIWIRPDAANARRLLAALAACAARVHKLTPPLTAKFLLGGHGFHFILPQPSGPVYVDVMGIPPRSGPFGAAHRRAQTMKTDWGTLHVAAIEDLVALKMTRRLSDYEVISNLVRLRLARESGAVARRLLRWASRFSFRAEDRVKLLQALGVSLPLERCRRMIAAEIAERQSQDVRYWAPIIAELKDLRRRGLLLEPGTPVSGLISR